MISSRWQMALGALCIAVVCASCTRPRPLSQDGGAVRGTASPSATGATGSTSSCQHVLIPAGDGGLSVAFGWDKGEHPFGQAESLLVCVGGGADRRVSLAADPGITVTPGELRTNGQNVALRFQVTVQPGTTGALTYTQTLAASGAGVVHTARFLTVTPSGRGWRFVDADPPPVTPKNRRHSKTTIQIHPTPSR